MDKVLEKTDPKPENTDKSSEKEDEDKTQEPEVAVAKPEFTTNLSGSVTYKTGDKAEALKVEVKTSDKGVITYQWYQSQTNTNGGGTPVEGETKNTFTLLPMRRRPCSIMWWPPAPSVPPQMA